MRSHQASYLASLLPIAGRGIPFTSFDGQAFVRLAEPSGGFYILPIRSPAYREWFFHQFYNEYDSLPTANAFTAILHHLEAEANQKFTNQRLAVWRRVGARGPNPIPHQILLDLADPERHFVEISTQGWTVTAGENALFQTSRPTVSLALPIPSDPQAPLATLRSCLNLPSRDAWLRCLAWLLAAFRPSGPFPVLILQGPPGCGKSFAARILRAILDPSTSPLTPVPFSVPGLLTLARHNWILAFDHVSTLSPSLTDAVCRLTSGLGASLSQNSRSDPEPLQQYFRRPVIFTVTDRWSCPKHLEDRAFTITLPPIPSECRQTELALVSTVQEALPAILGVLCSAVSTALARLPQLFLPSARCADALSWAIAAAPALACTEDEFRQAFASPPPLHPIVIAVKQLLEQRRRWTGTATELLALLQPLIQCKAPQSVSHHLKTAMLTLADLGIELKFRRLTQGVRMIELHQDPSDDPPGKTPQTSSLNLELSPQPPDIEEVKTW